MENNITISGIITAKELALQLRVSRITISRWLKNGKIPSFRIGKDYRIRKTDLDKFLNKAITRQAKLIEQKNENIN